MKRVSIRFSRTEPGTAGAHQRAQLQRDEAGGRLRLVGGVGQHHVDLGRLERARPAAGRTPPCGTAILSSGIGRPPSAMWKTPAVVRRSLAGLCRTPLTQPVAGQQRRGEAVAVEGQRQLAGQAGLVEHEGAAGQLRAARRSRRGSRRGSPGSARRRRTAGRPAAGSARAAGRGSAGRAGRPRSPRTPRAAGSPSWARRRLMAAFWVRVTRRFSCFRGEHATHGCTRRLGSCAAPRRRGACRSLHARP